MSMISKSRLLSVAMQFQIPHPPVLFEAIPVGQINDSYKVYLRSHGGNPDFILQKINTTVFKHPANMMENIFRISKHLAESGYYTPKVIRTKGEQLYHREPETKNLWRMMEYVPDSISYKTTPDSKIAREAGRILGRFHASVSGFPVKNLKPGIKNFHNPGLYYKSFLHILKLHSSYVIPAGVTEKLHEYKNLLNSFTELDRSGFFAPFPCHYDPKLGNMLFSTASGNGICLIDLDTLTPGIMAFDVGDAIRSVCISREAGFDADYFKSFMRGYLSQMASELSSNMLTLFFDAAKVMVIELTIRYLRDYLEGGIYFQNLNQRLRLKKAEKLLDSLHEMEENDGTIKNWLKNLK